MDEYGRIELHYACADSNSKLVADLLARGSNPNSQDDNGWTPLHFAAQASSLDWVTLLLQAGAETDLHDSFGNAPLFRAVYESRGDGRIIEALRQAGANPTDKNHDDISPLDLARTISNHDVAQFFSDIDDGA